MTGLADLLSVPLVHRVDDRVGNALDLVGPVGQTVRDLMADVQALMCCVETADSLLKRADAELEVAKRTTAKQASIADAKEESLRQLRLALVEMVRSAVEIDAENCSTSFLISTVRAMVQQMSGSVRTLKQLERRAIEAETSGDRLSPLEVLYVLRHGDELGVSSAPDPRPAAAAAQPQ